MIFVLLYSLICPLYHHTNNSILAIGYLFMRGVTFNLLWFITTKETVPLMFQQIDGEAFLLLTQADIVKVMNIKLGPAIKIYNSILMIKNNVDV